MAGINSCYDSSLRQHNSLAALGFWRQVFGGRSASLFCDVKQLRWRAKGRTLVLLIQPFIDTKGVLPFSPFAVRTFKEIP